MLKTTLTISFFHKTPLKRSDTRAIVDALNEDEYLSLVARDATADVQFGKAAVLSANDDVNDLEDDEDTEEEEEEEDFEDEEDDLDED